MPRVANEDTEARGPLLPGALRVAGGPHPSARGARSASPACDAPSMPVPSSCGQTRSHSNRRNHDPAGRPRVGGVPGRILRPPPPRLATRARSGPRSPRSLREQSGDHGGRCGLLPRVPGPTALPAQASAAGRPAGPRAAALGHGPFVLCLQRSPLLRCPERAELFLGVWHRVKTSMSVHRPSLDLRLSPRRLQAPRERKAQRAEGGVCSWAEAPAPRPRGVHTPGRPPGAQQAESLQLSGRGRSLPEPLTPALPGPSEAVDAQGHRQGPKLRVTKGGVHARYPVPQADHKHPDQHGSGHQSQEDGWRTG